METSFTPIEALLGGSLIGLAAVGLMALHGRVAGMTGILTGVILPKGDWDWRIACLLGAVAAPEVLFLFRPSYRLGPSLSAASWSALA